MKNTDLKPCPFCGGEAEVLVFGGVYMVQCETCGIATDTDRIKEDVIKKWNTRTNTIPVGSGENYTIKTRPDVCRKWTTPTDCLGSFHKCLECYRFGVVSND